MIFVIIIIIYGFFLGRSTWSLIYKFTRQKWKENLGNCSFFTVLKCYYIHVVKSGVTIPAVIEAEATKHKNRSDRAGQESALQPASHGDCRASSPLLCSMKSRAVDGIWFLGLKPSRELLDWPSLAATPKLCDASLLSAPPHHAVAASTSWCIRNISTSVIPKPSPEIYLAVEVENEYFTVHLPDQLPTSCCCIWVWLEKNTCRQW